MPISTKTTLQFIKEIKEIFGKDQYDLSKVEYINNKTKIFVGCNIHNDFFWIHPNHFLKDQGCKKCTLNQRQLQKCDKATKIFIEKSKLIHCDKYHYEKVKYINNREKVVIICINHGDFLQSPRHHLEGSGCHECGLFSTNKKKFTSEIQNQNTIELKQQLKNLFDDKYNLDKTIYNGFNKQTILICPVVGHGEFTRRLVYLLQGNGCQKCLEIYYNELSRIKEFKKFIKKSKKIHDNIYDYNKSIYINGRTKMSINCSKHGEFLQNPNSH